MTYHRPTSLEDALALAEGAMIAAGCTDLYPACAGQVLGRDAPVVDITAIPQLNGIRQDADGVTIGAATPWAAFATTSLPPAFDALKQAAAEVGSIQIQNAGTIGGNLCTASPAADGVPPLLVLEAEVTLAGPNGARRMPLQDFLTGPRRTALRPGEILTALHIPARVLTGMARFSKLGARRYLVISIAMVAVRLVVDQGRIVDACLAVGACSPVATRLKEAEATLIGEASIPRIAGLVEDRMVADALSPIADIRADADYRSTAAAVLLRRSIDAVLRMHMTATA